MNLLLVDALGKRCSLSATLRLTTTTSGLQICAADVWVLVGGAERLGLYAWCGIGLRRLGLVRWAGFR